MKFKKYAMGLILTASVFSFAACSPAAPAPAPVETPAETPVVEAPADAAVALENGDYMAEGNNFDERGWKPFVEMTVADGKISMINYDYMTEDGKLKTEDEEYNKLMKEKSGSNPQEYTVALENNLMETQDVEMVDNVTGATSSSDNFKALVKAIMDDGKPGETVKIDIAE